MPSDPQEIELKFVLDDAALDQLRWEVFGDARARPLHAIYYDTAGRALAERGFALRLRHDGERWVQTVKGHGAVARFEAEVERDGPTLDFGALGGAWDGSPDELAPVFEVRVERRTVDIVHGRSSIELALDEGSVTAGDAQTPLRELELELKSGEAGDLFEAARQLCLRPGVRLSLTSKAEQGYRLARGEAGSAPHAPAPRLAAEVTVREAFQALALSGLAELCTAAGLVETVDSVRGVHRARVALRRLRVLVGAFAPAVADEQVEAIKEALKSMTAVFADARSLDVFAQDAASQPRDDAGLDAVLQRAQAAAHERTQASVADPAFAGRLLRVAEWIVCGPWTREPALAAAGDQTLADLAARLLNRRRKQMRKRGRRLDWSDAHARHKLRIQAKKMHYLVDALAPGETHGDFYRRLKRLQAHLGDLNDIATAEATARLALGHDAPVAAAIAAGVLIGQRRAGADRLIRKAQRAFRKWGREPAAQPPTG
jgi:triphosphatase